MTTTAIATLIAQFGYPIALSIVLIWFLWHIHNPVSYTHLTLPTN